MLEWKQGLLNHVHFTPSACALHGCVLHQAHRTQHMLRLLLATPAVNTGIYARLPMCHSHTFNSCSVSPARLSCHHFERSPVRSRAILSQGNVTISNDGATIMKLLDVVHPAAKTLVDVSLSQDAEVITAGGGQRGHARGCNVPGADRRGQQRFCGQDCGGPVMYRPVGSGGWQGWTCQGAAGRWQVGVSRGLGVSRSRELEVPWGWVLGRPLAGKQAACSYSCRPSCACSTHRVNAVDCAPNRSTWHRAMHSKHPRRAPRLLSVGSAHVPAAALQSRRPDAGRADRAGMSGLG